MALRYRNYLEVQPSAFDAVVVGCGFAGSVVARELAERAHMRVLMLEKRNHIAGNMYDEYDKAGILVHRYGPHIFHTYDKRAFDYVRSFCDWRNYEHRVLARVYENYMPVPFNKSSMEIAFGKARAKKLTDKLIECFGDEKKVTITSLRAQNDPDLALVADYVYTNVFLYYSQKQWGMTPEELDPATTARVPVFISYDDRYFQDSFQGVPLAGYTALFEHMLDHPNIEICLGTEAQSAFELIFEGDEAHSPLKGIALKGATFKGPVIYTGALDELFLGRFGRLPYRSLNFEYESYDKEYVLPCGTVNFTVSQAYTRITEFKHLTGQQSKRTTIMKEYSCAYDDPSTQIPYYAVISDKNKAHYEQYRALTAQLDNFYLLGRLAQYQYFNMDQIISRALMLADELVERFHG